VPIAKSSRPASSSAQTSCPSIRTIDLHLEPSLVDDPQQPGADQQLGQSQHVHAKALGHALRLEGDGQALQALEVEQQSRGLLGQAHPQRRGRQATAGTHEQRIAIVLAQLVERMAQRRLRLSEARGCGRHGAHARQFHHPHQADIDLPT
jgi:hypothetical protein